MCPSVGKALTESHLTSITGGPDALSLLVTKGCNWIQHGCLSRGTAAQKICRPMGKTTAVFSAEGKQNALSWALTPTSCGLHPAFALA